MSLRKLFIAAFLAATAAGAAPSIAADLDQGYSYKDSPYDDPRYSDIYRHPAPLPAPRYATPYPPMATPPYVEQRYAPPPPPPPAYGADPRYGYDNRQAAGCVPRDVIRGQLEARGWHDFHDPHPAGNVVHIRARRPSGQVFDITLERCSGRVLGVEPLNQHAAVPPPPPPQQDWRYRNNGPYGRY